MRSTQRPAGNSGPTTRKCRANGAGTRAATRSTAASRCGATRSIVGDARRPPGVARRAHRPEALGSRHDRPHHAVHDHRRAARREGQGADRQRRRRVRRARLFLRLRREDRQARVAVLHRARQSRKTASRRRNCAMAAKTWNGEWWVGGGGGTVWDSMAYDPQLDTLLRRHRQRLAVGARDPLTGRRRQPVPVVDPRARPGRPDTCKWHYQVDARGQLGLHGHAAHHPGGPRRSTARCARC